MTDLHMLALIVPMDQLVNLLVTTLVFSLLGIVLFAIAFFIIVKIAPFSTRKEIEEDQNTALAILIGSVIIGIAIIVAAAVHGYAVNRTPILFLHVLIIATCGLVYELIAGTLASYVLGDSVTQFSLIIGIYLSALGAGAWLSRFVSHSLARSFIEVELAVAVLGGVSAPLLFLSFANLSYFHVV